MLFRVEPAIDFTGARTARDAYHDNVKLLVEPTLDEVLKRQAYPGDWSAKSFLLIDPVFRRALADAGH
jgi:hypothetical protein